MHKGHFNYSDIPAGEWWIPLHGSDLVAVVSVEDKHLRWLDWTLDQDGRYAVLTRWDEEKRREFVTTTLHRRVFGYVPAGMDIDHIDGDTLNCRRDNLRAATRSQNLANAKKYRNNASGYKGVSFKRSCGKWSANIGFRGRQIYLGVFLSPEAAALAYDAKALELFGQYARTNAALGLLKGGR